MAITGKIFWPILGLSLLAQACKKDQSNCVSMACTEEFVTLGVRVETESGALPDIDRYVSFLKNTGDTLTTDASHEPIFLDNNQRLYLYTTDGHKALFRNRTLTVKFLAFKNQETIIDEEFEVSADCCHVMYLSGSKSITLKQ